MGTPAADWRLTNFKAYHWFAANGYDKFKPLLGTLTRRCADNRSSLLFFASRGATSSADRPLDSRS